MNDTNEQFTKEHKDIDELELEGYKKHMKNTKEALQIVHVLINRQKNIMEILVEKRIE